jgi:hypothetical protein
MTEDMIDQHIELISSLSSADERTMAQVDILVSDMQAFKVLPSLFILLLFAISFRRQIRTASLKTSFDGTHLETGFNLMEIVLKV